MAAAAEEAFAEAEALEYGGEKMVSGGNGVLVVDSVLTGQADANMQSALDFAKESAGLEWKEGLGGAGGAIAGAEATENGGAFAEADAIENGGEKMVVGGNGVLVVDSVLTGQADANMQSALEFAKESAGLEWKEGLGGAGGAIAGAEATENGGAFAEAEALENGGEKMVVGGNGVLVVDSVLTGQADANMQSALEFAKESAGLEWKEGLGGDGGAIAGAEATENGGGNLATLEENGVLVSESVLTGQADANVQSALDFVNKRSGLPWREDSRGECGTIAEAEEIENGGENMALEVSGAAGSELMRQVDADVQSVVDFAKKSEGLSWNDDSFVSGGERYTMDEAEAIEFGEENMTLGENEVSTVGSVSTGQGDDNMQSAGLPWKEIPFDSGGQGGMIAEAEGIENENGVSIAGSMPTVQVEFATTPAGLPWKEHPVDSAHPGGEGDAKAVPNAAALGNGESNKVGLSVAELVAKARAPVKHEFLTPAAVRVLAPNWGVTGARSNNGVWDEETELRVGPERKSKRQMKRERLQAKKSKENICSVVARTGDVKQCPYGANCRFNHDLEGYKTQKPPDLPGKCPFLDSGEPCSYGIACRFASTHKDYHGSERVQQRRSNTAPNEQNSLSKDLQKLLWKNMGSYPKADAQLKAMGLMNKSFKLRKMEEEENKAHGPGKDGTEETLTEFDRTRVEIDKTATEPVLKTISTTPVNGESIEDLGVSRSVVIEGNTFGIPLDLDSRVQPKGNCSPPQKRLRTETDEPMMENMVDYLAKVNQPGDVEVSKTIPTLDTLDEKLYERSSAMDISTGDSFVKKDGINSADNKNGYQSLHVESKLGIREKKIIDFREKLYLAPLTTVGNLPFRRVCKALGADITCGEMAMCTNLLQGQASEWALMRRHTSEDVFGVQICGSFPDHMARTAELIEQECAVDFIDINVGCPIDLVVNKGAGSCLLTKPQRLEQIVRATAAVMENPLTLKVRMGYFEGRNCAHSLMPNLSEWGVNAVTIHGRTRQQRYSKMADWSYVQQCAVAAEGNVQVIGNGDVFSYTDWNDHLQNSGSKLSTCMIARGALVKPWLFVEIKEGRHWDISSGERLDILRQYVHSGLSHWGSDSKGVETTRHFLLEWLSYMHRYIPVGLLEVVPQCLNWRPPSYFGRNDLETMMASDSAADWVRISELLLGPTPANFVFKPKHKSNAYDRPENG